MPITISNRNVGSGNGSLMTPILANNPAFKVEILPVDGRLEQKPFAKDGSREIEAVKVGDAVQGQIVNSKDTVKGKVLQINRQNGEIVSYKVLDKDGEDVLLDPTTVTRYSDHGEDGEAVGGAGYSIDNEDEASESFRVKGYHDWLAESGK